VTNDTDTSYEAVSASLDAADTADRQARLSREDQRQSEEVSNGMPAVCLLGVVVVVAVVVVVVVVVCCCLLSLLL
jgi:Flp pilus assembly protein TadB